MKRLMNISEAAALLNTSERALWQRVYRGQVPHRRWGKRVVFRLEELEQFLNELPGLTASEIHAGR